MKNTNSFVENCKYFLRTIETIKSRKCGYIKKNNQYQNIIAHIEKYRTQYYDDCLPVLKPGRAVGNNLLLSIELYAYKCLNENYIAFLKHCMYTYDRLYSKEEIEKILINEMEV